MIYMNISALTMEEAEIMLKIIDKWLRHFFNTHGVQRLASFNKKANDNFRAQIRVTIDEHMWEYIQDGAMWESVHRLNKGMSFHREMLNDTTKVIEFSTAEATI